MKKLLLLVVLLTSNYLLCQTITSQGDYIKLRGEIVGEITSVHYREAELTKELVPEDFHILTVMNPGYRFNFENSGNFYSLMKRYDSEVISWELTMEENRNLKTFHSNRKYNYRSNLNRQSEQHLSLQSEQSHSPRKNSVNSGQNLIRAGLFKNLALVITPAAILTSSVLNEASSQNVEVARSITTIGIATSVGFYIAGNIQLILAGKKLKQLERERAEEKEAKKRSVIAN